MIQHHNCDMPCCCILQLGGNISNLCKRCIFLSFVWGGKGRAWHLVAYPVKNWNIIAHFVIRGSRELQIQWQYKQ
jgi:hypothetical protein